MPETRIKVPLDPVTGCIFVYNSGCGEGSDLDGYCTLTGDTDNEYKRLCGAGRWPTNAPSDCPLRKGPVIVEAE